MSLSLFFDQVERHFRYLIDDCGFSVVKKKRYKSFDNAEIILHSKKCHIRVLRERGHISVDAGPALLIEEWYDLATLISYLTKEAEQLKYKIPEYEDYDAEVEWQVERLAGILQTYYVQICELFHRETYNKKRVDLKNFINLRRKKRWN